MPRALLVRLLLAALVALGQVGAFAHALTHVGESASDHAHDAAVDEDVGQGEKHVHDCSLCSAYAPAFLGGRTIPPDVAGSECGPRAFPGVHASDLSWRRIAIRGPPHLSS